MFDFIKYKFVRQHFICPLFGFFLLIGSSCNSPLAPDDTAQISLEITISDPSGLNKTSAVATITRVVVIVSTGIYETESYQELVVKELTITGRSAQGTISVPMGQDRTFRVRAYDANDFIQYHGNSKSMDIVEKTFTVEIVLAPLPPNTPTLSYNSGTDQFSWSKSIALDFAAYEMYRANSPGVTLSSDRIYTAGTIDSTFFVDSESLPEGDYYYRLFVVDTEGLRSDGSNEVKRIIIN